MEKLSMAALNRPSTDEYQKQKKIPVVLVLDNVRSGLNVGSVFRTADAFSVEKIVLCGITAQPPHREILKTALGSTESVTWEYVAETARAILQLQSSGYRVFAVEQTSHKTWLQDFRPTQDDKFAFVLGNEVEGVGEAALDLCEGAIEIPQSGTKHSLNVAVAAGIVVWELSRKINYASL